MWDHTINFVAKIHVFWPQNVEIVMMLLLANAFAPWFENSHSMDFDDHKIINIQRIPLFYTFSTLKITFNTSMWYI